MIGHQNYCDHEWVRDDQHCKQCVKCKARKEA